MPISQPDSLPTIEAARSRLSQALLRLKQGMERSRSQEAKSDALFADWQQKWAGRRDEINYRLTLIESQLASLEKPTQPLRLSLVAKDEG